MNGKYLLDTNIIIALFENDSAVTSKLADADEVFIPIIAIGELLFGAYKANRVQENINRLDSFVANSAVLGCDTETARQYGKIKNELRSRGRPIPENDIWIAAIAVEHGLTLVTRDAHFDQVSELDVTNW